MIPAWLQAHIRANKRTATLTVCRKCRAPILTGLDNDTCALTARADPTPITALGETVALLQGRATYNLATIHSRKRLEHRDQWHITMPRKHPVLPEHRCGQPLNDYAETIRHTQRKYEVPNECPY